jgi:hypothetical protein
MIFLISSAKDSSAQRAFSAKYLVQRETVFARTATRCMLTSTPISRELIKAYHETPAYKTGYSAGASSNYKHGGVGHFKSI